MSRRVAIIAALLASSAGIDAASAQPAQPAPPDEEDDLEIPVEAAPPAPAPVPEPAPAPVPEPTPAPVPAPVVHPLAEPPAPATVPAVEATARPTETDLATLLDRAGLELSGYVQGQYEGSSLSEDQIQQGGTLRNQDQFAVRRGRITVERRWSHAGLLVELDASTVRSGVGVRRAHASLRWPSDDPRHPLAELTVGLFDVPFGHELVEPTRQRAFMERSTGSVALFPGEADVGAQVSGAYRFLRYAAALQSGEVSSDRAGTRRSDPNAAKDLTVRVGAEARPAGERVTISGGVSVLAGTGFHQGKDATKDGIEWRDLNENGSIDTGELMPVPGTAASPSVNFDRWAIGADLAVSVATRLGKSQLTAELAIASNLDRGLFVADPVAAGGDLRHLSLAVAFVQDVGARYFGGVRFDRYDPDLDFFDERSGMLVPTDSSITTISPLLGVHLPWRARLTTQYDVVVDHLARDGLGVPTDLRNDRWTARLQVEL
jgi:hypothetical protein